MWYGPWTPPSIRLGVVSPLRMGIENDWCLVPVIPAPRKPRQRLRSIKSAWAVETLSLENNDDHNNE